MVCVAVDTIYTEYSAKVRRVRVDEITDRY